MHVVSKGHRWRFNVVATQYVLTCTSYFKLNLWQKSNIKWYVNIICNANGDDNDDNDNDDSIANFDKDIRRAMRMRRKSSSRWQTALGLDRQKFRGTRLYFCTGLLKTGTVARSSWMAPLLLDMSAAAHRVAKKGVSTKILRCSEKSPFRMFQCSSNFPDIVEHRLCLKMSTSVESHTEKQK